MTVFSSSQPRASSKVGQAVRRHPSLFAIPFLVLMVGASFGLQTFTQVRYEVHDGKRSQVSKEEELGLNNRRRKFDIREEYYRLQSAGDQDWEPKRVARPPGVPEWGVPPVDEKK
ncbi:hypothetical protein SISNIDRAFT_447931 [Sistotremastrum niveocremeum HHB9708]|uniref:Cytochrome c oxidase assembly protein COX16, mitochondrial n=1 Tax=Sistotremastrum niveocremeum HHB9708 TaxID=1314777 RepID=A0A165AJ47_9AGAM|nr:hypothetical protein SISNIDRAFT_447931 [Sistotremastrum niveocremeum HHB9708]